MRRIKCNRSILIGLIASRALWNPRPRKFKPRAEWASFYEYCLSDM